jgi:hypothetical protein
MKQAENKAGEPATEHVARGSKRKKTTPLPVPDEGKCKHALESIKALHGLLRDLHLEMRTFEFPLPLHEVRFHEDEVKDEAGLTKLIMRARDSHYINYAKLLDVILGHTQEISSGLERGAATESLDGSLYTLQGRLTELVAMHSKASALNIALANTNIDWVSEENYNLVYDSIEAISPFVHDKIGIFHSSSGALNSLEKAECSCRFKFDEQQKKAFKKASRLISHVEDLMSCIVNLAVNIDEEINCLVERYLQPGRDLSDDDKRVVQDVRKMLREMTDIEDSLLQGMAVNEAATKGQILGLVAFFCMHQVNLWLNRKIFFQSKVFEKPSDELFLCPLQSAGGLLKIAEMCNTVRRRDLLSKTAHIKIG